MVAQKINTNPGYGARKPLVKESELNWQLEMLMRIEEAPIFLPNINTITQM